MNKKILQPGFVINRLTVIEEIEPRIRSNGYPRRLVRCRCICGAIKDILFDSLSSGRVVSCGCWQREVVIKGAYAKTHGLSSHPLFNTWRRMIDRCYNPKHDSYKNYGARGIIVCDEWKNNAGAFIEWALKNGWKKGLEVDKDIKGQFIYSPNSCLIVPRYVNLMNRRCTKNKIKWPH